MSEEPRREPPRHEPNEWERASRPTTQSAPAAQPLHYHAARHGNHVEESPELLRWRADLLMDEMMMGGVDMSAADSHRTFTGVTTPVMPRLNPSVQPSNPAPANGYPVDYGRSPREDAAREDGVHPARSDYDRFSNGSPVNGTPATSYERTDLPQERHDAAYPPAETRPVNPEPSTPARYDDYARPAPTTDYSAATNYSTEVQRTSEPYRTEDRPEFDRAAFERSAPRPYDYETGERNSYERERRMDYDPQARAAQERADDARFDDAPSARDERATPSPSPANYAPRPPVEDGARYSAAERYDGAEEARPARPDVDEPPAPSPYPPLRTTMESVPPGGRGEQPPRGDRLYSVEQQYEQFRREQSANVQPVEPQRPAVRPPLPPVEASRPPTSPPRVTPPRPDEHTQWATGPDKWEYQDFSADPDAPQEDPAFSGLGAPERRLNQESAVRQDQAQFVSAMSVFSNNNKKRSTLLPRSTELDIDTLHREISDLHGEIAALLPVGNETSERARHLLDKAYSILQSDPSRSAEVEYYMQQVRTIVQRLHQSRQWSDLYRQRLHVYLLGWMGLSFMVLLARFAFQIDLEDALMWLFGLSLDSWVVTHWATFVGTSAAGAFGGALGALYTMQNHARSEYSFFDRKYGLRGLILPFMGAIVGAFGYIIFGLIFALVGINPSQSLTAAIVPTMAALAFGFSQESIYGTRS